MNKTVRVLIVAVVFLTLIILEQRNNSGSPDNIITVQAIAKFKAEPTALAASNTAPVRQKFIFIEFFAGL